MPGQSASPALSDDELRETLDVMGTVLASVSDRVDAQTEAMDGLVKTAIEARQAAFAARSQTDPKKYGELVGETIDGKIKGNLDLLGKMINDLGYKMLSATKTLKKTEEDKWKILRQVRDREKRQIV